ncbi:MAG TPA: hypothetical protein VFH48_10325 [Chloroflexota bacterium]|nr:hypothetical protein [Chloroflexota bacterium]
MASTEVAQVAGPAALRGQTDLGSRRNGRAGPGSDSLGILSLGRAVPGHWLLPFLIAVAVALFSESAYLLAERSAAGRGIFAGQIWAPHDVAQYIAAMNDGARGEFLIRDRLTSEAHAPAFIYGYYVLLGMLWHALGIDAQSGYRLAGLAGRVFVLLAVYRATSMISPAPWRRQVAFGLTIFGGGLISLVTLLQIVTGLEFGLSGRDLEEPEFGTFILMFASPHLMFGLGLMLLATHAYARACRSHHVSDGMLAAVLTFAVGIVNSYSLATVCTVVSVHAVAMTVLSRRLVWRGLVAAALVNVATVPILGYGVLTFVLGTDPFWGVAYGRQNVTPTPTVANVLVSFGLAITGLCAFGRRLTSGRVLVLVWIVTMALLMYLPVGVQRRFAFGLQPMLAFVAAFGPPPVWRFVSAYRPRPWTMLRPIMLLLLFQALAGSPLVLGAVAVSQALDAGTPGRVLVRPDFYPASLEPAATWLAERIGSDDVVLAKPTTGNYLLREIIGRVYVGHWSATVEYERKRDETSWFFAGPLDESRRQFVADRQVRYVVAGPIERADSDWSRSAEDAAWLSRVYEADGVAIFAVTEP